MRWLCCLLLLVALPCWGQDLVLKNDGKPVATIPLAELGQRFGEHTVEASEGHDGVRRRYRAVSLPEVLKAVYGAELRGEQDLVFICSDGYASNVDVADIIANQGWLAYGFADGGAFRTDHDLGPFMLVWDTGKFPRQKTLGSWPYEVTSLDLVDFSQRYAKVLPPAGSRPEVGRGFAAFRHRCLSCHKVNGQGGDRGPDLNWPVSVTRYIAEPYLSAIIDNPTKVRANCVMPAFPAEYPERARVIKDIVAYLKAMAAGGKKR